MLYSFNAWLELVKVPGSLWEEGDGKAWVYVSSGATPTTNRTGDIPPQHKNRNQSISQAGNHGDSGEVYTITQR